MDVLIAVASRHGATAEVADRIAEVLRRRGHHVDLVDIDPTRWLDDEHDAYIVGSAVYLHRWHRSARHFAEVNRPILSRHPLWLFSSGPLGDGDTDVPVPTVGVGPLGEREHRVFGGRLDRDRLGPLESVAARAVGAQPGDYRPWDEIEGWANEIADELLVLEEATPSNGRSREAPRRGRDRAGSQSR